MTADPGRVPETQAQWDALRLLAGEYEGAPTWIKGRINGSAFGVLVRSGLAVRVRHSGDGGTMAAATDAGLERWDEVKWNPPAHPSP